MSFSILFPSAIDSIDTLLEAKNALINTLANSISASDASLSVDEVITSYPDKGFLKYDAEILEYHAKNNETKTFSSLVRGADGTTATSHSAGTTGRLCNAARYRQILVDLNIAFLRKIGIVSASEPSYPGGNEAGDKWVDSSAAPIYVFKMHDGTSFVEISGGGGMNQDQIAKQQAFAADTLTDFTITGVPSCGFVAGFTVQKSPNGAETGWIKLQFFQDAERTVEISQVYSNFDLNAADLKGQYVAKVPPHEGFHYDLVAGTTLYVSGRCQNAITLDLLFFIEVQMAA